MKGYLVTVVESNSRSIFVSGESAQSDEQASELVKQYYENKRIAVGSKYLEDFDVSSVDIDSEHLKYMGDNISTLEEALAEVPNSVVRQNVQPVSAAPEEPKIPPSRPSQQIEVAAFGAFSSTPQSTLTSGDNSQICPTEVGDIIELNGKRFEAIAGIADVGFEMLALDSFGEASVTSMVDCMTLFYEDSANSRTAEWYNSLTTEQKGVMKKGYPDNASALTKNLRSLYVPNTHFVKVPPRDKAYFVIREYNEAFFGVSSDGEECFENPKDAPFNIYPMFTWLPGKTCNGRNLTSTDTNSSEEDSQINYNNTKSPTEDSQICPTDVGDVIELNGKRFETIDRTDDGGFKMLALDSFGQASVDTTVECLNLFYEDGYCSLTSDWYNSLTLEQKNIMEEGYPDAFNMLIGNRHRLQAPTVHCLSMPSRNKNYFAVDKDEISFYGVKYTGRVDLVDPEGESFDIYPTFNWLPGKMCTGRKVDSADTDSAGESNYSQTVTSESSANKLTHPTKIGDVIELNGKRFEAVERTSNGDFEMMSLDSFGEMSTTDTEECMKFFYENSLSSKTAVWFSSLTPEQKSIMKEGYPDMISRYTNTLRRLHAPNVKSSGMPSRDKDYSALSQADNAFFRIYSSGRVGFQPAANPLAIYPMFTWISGKTLDGSKVTSTDASSSEEVSQDHYDSTNSSEDDSQVCPTKVGDVIELNGKRFEVIDRTPDGDFEMLALDSFGEASVTRPIACLDLFYEDSETSRTADWFNSLTTEQKDIMKECCTDRISIITDELHRLHAPDIEYREMPSRDKAFFAVNDFESSFFEIYSSGNVGLRNPEGKLLNIYPMFTWLLGKTCNGRKIASTNTNSAGESDHSQTANSEPSEEDSPVSYNNTNSSVSEASQVCPTKIGDVIELNGKRFEAVKCTFDGNFSMMSLDSFGEARAAGIENCMNLFYEDSENSRTAEWFNTLTTEQKNVMKEDYPDNLSFGLDHLRRLNAPNVLFMQPPSRDKNYFAISDFATEVVEIYSTGEVGIKNPTEQLAIYPTFIWLSDKTCNGRKITSTDTESVGETAPSKTASSEPSSNIINASEVLFKESDTSVDDVDEQQTVNWGDFTIFSHYNKNDNKIHIDVKNKSGEVLYSKKISPYLEEGMLSHSQFKNGDLDIIFDEGKVNKCIGFCLYLEYSYPRDDRSTPIFYSIYLEYLADKGTIEEYESYPWNFDEMGSEPIYSEEEDRIVMSDYKNGGRNF